MNDCLMLYHVIYDDYLILHHVILDFTIIGLGRYLFKLFQHPSLAIVKAAGLIMKTIIEVHLALHPDHMRSCDSCRREMLRQQLTCRSWPWLREHCHDTYTQLCLLLVVITDCWPIGKHCYKTIINLVNL